MFNKIRNRYVLTNMVLIGSLITLSFIGIYILTYQNGMNAAYDQLYKQYTYIDQEAKEMLTPEILYYVLDESDEIVEQGSNWYENSELKNRLIEEGVTSSKKYQLLNDDERTFMIIYKKKIIETQIQNKVESIIVFQDVTTLYQQLKNLFLIMFLLLLIVLGLIFIICVYLANKSVERLKEAWDKQRQFIGDASHELKTPLAIIEANVDALRLSSDNEWIHNIKNETKRMNTLLTDLLYLTQIDDYDLSFEYREVNISNLVEAVILSNEVMVFEQGLTLKTKLQEDIVMLSDEDKLKQLVHILMDNALKYSDNSIEVILKKEFNTITFSVENTGEGIHADELSKVFDRFYKGDKSRHSTSKSYGLGLSIAQAIAKRMQADLYVQSVMHEKTKFTLIFEV